jgi:hypothetical protein
MYNTLTQTFGMAPAAFGLEPATFSLNPEVPCISLGSYIAHTQRAGGGRNAAADVELQVTRLLTVEALSLGECRVAHQFLELFIALDRGGLLLLEKSCVKCRVMLDQPLNLLSAPSASCEDFCYKLWLILPRVAVCGSKLRMKFGPTQ